MKREEKKREPNKQERCVSYYRLQFFVLLFYLCIFVFHWLLAYPLSLLGTFYFGLLCYFFLLYFIFIPSSTMVLGGLVQQWPTHTGEKNFFSNAYRFCFFTFSWCNGAEQQSSSTVKTSCSCDACRPTNYSGHSTRCQNRLKREWHLNIIRDCSSKVRHLFRINVPLNRE